MLYRIEGQYGKAEKLSAKVLRIRETTLGADHPDVGVALNNLATTYYSERRFPEAELLLRRALDICQKSLATYVGTYSEGINVESPCVIASLTNLATVERDEHRYAEAESHYQRALTIEEKTLTPEHPEVFRTLVNLARTYWLQQRYDGAEPLYVRCITIGKKSLGAGHPDMLAALSSYAQLLRKLHRKAEAIRIEAEVRHLHAASHGESPAKLEVDWRDLQPKGR